MKTLLLVLASASAFAAPLPAVACSVASCGPIWQPVGPSQPRCVTINGRVYCS